MNTYLSEHQLHMRCDKDLGPAKNRPLQKRTLQLSNGETLCEIDEEEIGTKVYSRLWYNVLHKYSTHASRPVHPMYPIIEDAIMSWAQRQKQQENASDPPARPCRKRPMPNTSDERSSSCPATPRLQVAPAAEADAVEPKSIQPQGASIECMLVCPITLEHMEDPVTLPCGHNFERAVIEEHLRAQKTCPTCMRQYRGQLSLGSNVLLRELCSKRMGCGCGA